MPAHNIKSLSLLFASKYNMVIDFFFFSYYIEAIHSENTDKSSVKVAARHLDTKFVSSMTGFAKKEIQKIKVTSQGRIRSLVIMYLTTHCHASSNFFIVKYIFKNIPCKTVQYLGFTYYLAFQF